MRSRTIDTPIGVVTLAGTVTGGGTEVVTHLLMDGQAHAPDVTDWVEDPTAFAGVVSQLEAYFAGELEDFDVELDLVGTDFQRAVWQGLRDIPYGTTWTYGELAAHIGRPSAVRAVGLANGRNPVAIIVPCHRVIGADGTMTGYGGGIERKQALLGLERCGSSRR